MKPGLLMLPSAVSDSRVHNILPNKIETDFQFSRASSATRVNHQGLIEDVGYFSPELVQNGDFSELGPELIVNGDFATDSDWSLGTGWSISNGKLRADNVSLVNAFQAKIYTSGKTYKVTYTISDYVKGQVRFQLGGGGSTVNGEARGANGTYTEYVVATNNHTSARFRGLSTDGGFTGNIDNVSVKQVDPNNYWTLGTGWSIEDGVAISDGSQTGNSGLIQNSVFESGKNYILKFDLTSNGQVIKFWVNGSQNIFSSALASGSYKYEFTTTVSGSAYFEATVNFVGTLSNVSVVEVLGDKPRLDYDPTNPTCPHLLLEPQSTNIVEFSEDINQSYWTKSDTIVNTNQSTSPDGNINAYSIVSSTVNSVHYLRHSFVAVTALTPHTYSFFIKPNGYTKFGVRDNAQTGANLTYDLQTESVIHSASMTIVVNKLKDNWFRCSLTSTIGSNGVAGYALYLLDDGYGTPPNAGDPNNYNYTGDGVSGFYIYGFQLEQKPYATSYIPTAGATETRVAETCNTAGNVDTFNSTEGVLYAEIAALADDGTARTISINNTVSNRVFIQFRSSTGQVNSGVVVGGSLQGSSLSHSISQTSNIKMAFKYKPNDYALFVNGSKVADQSSGNTFSAGTLNDISFDSGNGAEDFYGKVKGLATYNRALIDTELYTITSTQYSAYSGMVAALGNYTIPC